MLDTEEILAIIASELSLADATTYSGVSHNNLEDSLNYYLGNPNGTEVEGRSQVTSTDVADAIEWIMPQVMKSFTQNNEIVVFDPVHEGDEKQSELESEYVYEVLMKQNDGFIILHQFVKDALMQRNGILKCYYSEDTKVKVSDWTGITEEQFDQLLSAEGVELLEQSNYIDDAQTKSKQQQIQMQIQMLEQRAQQMVQQSQGQDLEPQMRQSAQMLAQLEAELNNPVILYNVKVSVSRIKGKIYIDPVPPEEFRLNNQHNSINLDNARFTAHVLLKSQSDIITEYDISLEEIEDLPEGATFYDREYRFSLQEGSVFHDRVETGDESQRLIEIAECFIQIDIDETGVSKLMKITTAGGDTPTDILRVEEIEDMPWISTTAFLMSHKFQGLSITDRLKEIQDHKTALWRNMLDNMYLQNNQRNVVVEGQVKMDDLLVSRPGGVIRAKRLDAISPLVTPQIGDAAYSMMEYLDRVRAGRTGVDPDGTATPQNIGDRVGSQGVDRLMNAKEELVGLIIRVIAETGIKPLCVKIRDLSVKHVDSVADFKFKGIWQKINPSEWMDRTRCTVRVGTGTGNHMSQVMALKEVMAIQERITVNPSQVIVDQSQIYTALDDFCKFSGLNGATRYFIDPDSEQGKKKQENISKQNQESQAKNDEIQINMAKSQMELAKAEQGKAEAQMLSARAKAETDQAKNQLVLQKQTYESQLSIMKQQLEEAKAISDNMGKTADLDLRKYESDQKTALELVKIESTNDTEENQNFKENKQDITDG